MFPKFLSLLIGAKPLPGISACLKALTFDSYSLLLFTENASDYGQLNYNLFKDGVDTVWEGEATATGSWSYIIIAGAENSLYQLYIHQKSAIFIQPTARHVHGKQFDITDHFGIVRAIIGAGLA